MRRVLGFYAILYFATSILGVDGKVVLVSVTGTGYGPTNIKANVGDTIQISFTVGTASYTQSSLSNPCSPLPGGQNSGTVVIPPGAGPKQFTFTVTSSDPIFYFNFANGDTSRCRAGFVGTINASAQQLLAFQANAKNFNANLVNDHTSAPPHIITVISANSPTATTNPVIIQTTPPPSATAIFISSPNSTSSSNNALTSQSSSSSSSPSSISSLSSLRSSSSGPATGTALPLSPVSATLSSPTSTASDSSNTGSNFLPPDPPNPDRSMVGHQAIIALVGSLIGMVGFGLIILAFFLYRRRRDREGLSLASSIDPYSRRPQPRLDISSVSSGPSLMSRISRMVTPTSWRSWQRLDDEEKRVTPYDRDLTPSSPPPPVPPKPSAALLNVPMHERRVSEATLVSSIYRTQSSADHSDVSMIVNVQSRSPSEKGVDISSYPFISPLPRPSEDGTFPKSIKNSPAPGTW